MIVEIGDMVLRRVAQPFDGSTADAVALRDRLRSALAEQPGVGISAPQIGESVRAALICDPPEFLEAVKPAILEARERTAVPEYLLINPVLEVLPEMSAGFFEACLSVPGYFALVHRHRAVRVTYLDETLVQRSIVARGWHARILQHELDHLDGILYVDRMAERSLVTDKSYAAHWRYAVDPVAALQEALS
jgi:peptide deformylase